MNARGHSIDTTHLSIDTYEERGILHRDYIAHCFRWTYVLRQLRRVKQPTILDVGCGEETPLAKTIYTNSTPIKQYVGVDYNHKAALTDVIKPTSQHFAKYAVHPNIDFMKWNNTDKFDFVICLEMLEHIEPLHAFNVVKSFRRHCHPETTVIISTPNYSPIVGAADNHVNEMRRELVEFMLLMNNFLIVDEHGTFASQRDYYKHLSPCEKEVFDALSDYYDANLLAVMFAPLYPQYSRNVIYTCRMSDIRTVSDAAIHDRWEYLKNGHASSTSAAKWKEFASVVAPLVP